MSESWQQAVMRSVDDPVPVAMPVCPRRFDRCEGAPGSWWDESDEYCRVYDDDCEVM